MNWHAYWAVWALACFTTFAGPEMAAVFTGHPDRKLSASAWALEDYIGYPLVWRIAAGALLALIFWHLFYGSRH